ncbi:MAG: hypothetical protein AMXMBFR74_10540 [Parvibaculum sp.]|uniref:I78 family peptidase inhibitor n=1 Tax=Parvibaculum sp. TaxID=2024848 RepID=UPI0035B8B199
MTFSLKHLLGSVAIAALVTVAACDQNEEEKAADATAEEAPAVDNAVPMTAEPGAVDSAMPEGDMPDSSMPGSEMDESDMSMGEEAAAEGADAETITGAADEAAAGCQSAADALGVWTGKSYDEAKGDIEAGEGVATIRVIRPDQAVTQDFRPDRLNVELDAEDKVTRIYCG